MTRDIEPIRTPAARAPWSSPRVRRLMATDAETHSAIAPDGLGDQLS